MTFGGQTVTFVNYTDTGSPGRVGTIPQTPNPIAVTGCRHRPLSFKEAAEYDLNTSTQVWKTTAPPVAAVLALEVDGELRENGGVFKAIAGPQVFNDLDGKPFKVTILSQRKVT